MTAVVATKEPLRLSHSSISDYQNCRRYYRISRIQNIEKKLRGTALYIGSAFHKFKEEVYAGQTVENAIASMSQAFDECPTSLMDAEQIGKWEIEKTRIEAIARAWADLNLEADREQFVEFRVEEHVEMELFPGCTYHGYIDCLVKDTDGNWWVLETKTAAISRVNEDYFSRIYFDNQVVGYMHLANHLLGAMPSGVIYDVACKTTHRKMISKGETTQQFCNRIKELYLEPENRKKWFLRPDPFLIGKPTLEGWLRDTTYMAHEIHDKYERGEDKPGGIWPRSTQQCMGKFGACKFLSICQKGYIDPDIYEKRKPYVRK